MDLQTFNAAYQRAKAYQSSENCFHQGSLLSYEQLYGEHQMCGVVHLLRGRVKKIAVRRVVSRNGEILS